MKYSRLTVLLVVLLLIGGSIYLLDSQKVSPKASVTSSDDIGVADVFDLESSIVDASNTITDPTKPNKESTKTAMESDSAPASSQSKPEKIAVTKTRQEVIAEKATQYERAKEISTPDHFINTDPFTIQELIGKKVILVDFWTYSCINCQRTTPYLNSWYDKYEDDGLVIVGIHTPEFEFEKDIDNVEQATKDLGIRYPVVMDNDYSTWGAYRNRYWPRKYLIDIDGFIVYDHIGEGRYEETEKKIVELLNEKNDVLGMQEDVALDTSKPTNVDSVEFNKVSTRESYFGSSRIEFIANLPSKDCLEKSCSYSVPDNIPVNTFALDGTWKMQPEYAEHAVNGGSIYSHFSAGKLNLVAGADEPITAELYLDGAPIPEAFQGKDVVDGKVTIQLHDLYNLVDLHGEYGDHILEIRFNDGTVQAYALTFG